VPTAVIALPHDRDTEHKSSKRPVTSDEFELSKGMSNAQGVGAGRHAAAHAIAQAYADSVHSFENVDEISFDSRGRAVNHERDDEASAPVAMHAAPAGLPRNGIIFGALHNMAIVAAAGAMNNSFNRGGEEHATSSHSVNDAQSSLRDQAGNVGGEVHARRAGGAATGDASEYDDDDSDSGATITCGLCTAVCLTKSDLEAHLRDAHHTKTSDGEFRCQLCDCASFRSGSVMH
jgi:hypothetical protein